MKERRENKDVDFEKILTSLDELQNLILQEATSIDREMIRNAVTHFYNRIAFCQEAQGFQFEHLQ